MTLVCLRVESNDGVYVCRSDYFLDEDAVGALDVTTLTFQDGGVTTTTPAGQVRKHMLTGFLLLCPSAVFPCGRQRSIR